MKINSLTIILAFACIISYAQYPGANDKIKIIPSPIGSLVPDEVGKELNLDGFQPECLPDYYTSYPVSYSVR